MNQPTEAALVDAVFVDIDNTLTKGDIFDRPQDDILWGNQVLHLLAACHARQHACDVGQSQSIFRKLADDVIYWDYHDFIDHGQLDVDVVLREVREFHSRRITGWQDAIAAIHALKNQGVKLYIMSNNPVSGSLWKLQAIGLSDGSVAPMFEDIFGSNNLQGQKSAPQMWQRALDKVDKVGLPPGRLATLGDNPEQDGVIPLQLGVSHACLLNRDHPDTMQQNQEAITRLLAICQAPMV